MTMNVAGETVKKLRLERGWSQEHLAHLAGVNVRTIQRVEKHGVCDLETRSALASVFQIDATQLDGKKKIEQARKTYGADLLFYQRVLTGQELVDTFIDTYWYRLTNEEPRSSGDADLIAWFIRNLHDYADCWSDLDPGDRVQSMFELGQSLKELEDSGFRLFGLRTKSTVQMMVGNKSKPIAGFVANLHVAYADSEKIVILDPKADK